MLCSGEGGATNTDHGAKFRSLPNAQLADVHDLKSASHKDSDELDGIIVRVRQDLEKRMDRADTRVTDAVNALARAIADVAKKSNG